MSISTRVLALSLFTLAVSSAQQPPPVLATPGNRVLRIGLKEAVDLALSPEGSLAIQIGQRGEDVARGKSAQALAPLLPRLDVVGGYREFQQSFGAAGLTEVQLPFGLRVPQRVGPLSVVDTRAQVSSTILNFGAIRQYQATKAGIRTAEAQTDEVRNEVAVAVTRQYVLSLRAMAQVEAIQANLTLAQAIYQQARRNVDAGSGIGLDVTRAEVDLSNQRQRLLEAQSDLEQANLGLLRAIGQPLDFQVELIDRLSYEEVSASAIEEIMAQAVKARPDLETQRRREETARLSASASRYNNLPSIAGYADYGITGNVSQTLQPTRTVGVTMSIPLFDYNRRARTAEMDSQHKLEQTRTRDMEQEIEMEVRRALIAVKSAAEQVATAEGGLQLAENEVAQAQRRFAEGIAGSLEVTEAQARVARARDNRVLALFSHTMRRIDLYWAVGIVLQMF